MSKNERVELARAAAREYARAIRPQDRRQLAQRVHELHPGTVADGERMLERARREHEGVAP